MDLNILGFKEKLKDQLNGEQIAGVLDTLINNAMQPILETTYLIEDTLIEMVPLIIDNKRRKISPFANDELAARIFSFVTVKDPATKASMLRDMQLERSISFHLLNLFYEHTRNYNELLRRKIKLKKAKNKKKVQAEIDELFQSIRPKTSTTLFYAANESQRWMNLAFRFRSMIDEKFLRMSFLRAVKYTKATKLRIDVMDLFGDLTISTMKAIDKYRAEKGALPSFIEWWLKDGATQSASTHEYNVAYHIPAARRRAMLARGEQVANFSVEIDDKTLEDEESPSFEAMFMDSRENERYIAIAAQADKTRYGFLDFGFMYTLTDADKRAMRATLKPRQIPVYSA